MLVLVTGSTGFIGSHLCRALVEEGHDVCAFHRPSSPQLLLEGLGVKRVVGDITKLDTLKKAMQGVELVFHAAAMLGRRTGDHFDITVAGTRNVLAAAHEAGVRRFIHTSSVAALGVPEDGKTPQTLMDEQHVWNGRPKSWPYGYSKYLAEVEVSKAAADSLDAVIVNPTLVFGAGDLNRISGELILRVARGHAPVAIPGGLNAVHIDDVVRGHLSAMKRGRIGERYILGGENLSHKSLLEIVAEVVGVDPPRIVLPKSLVQGLSWPISIVGRWVPLPIKEEALSRVGYYFYYDTSKAQRELGLEETRPVREAVDEAYAWYRAQGIL